MTLGGAHAWTNLSYGYFNQFPRGWLLNPVRSILKLFIRNKKSARSNIRIFVYTYYVNDFREPSAFKSVSQMTLDDAWDKWHNLQLEVWTFEELVLPEGV